MTHLFLIFLVFLLFVLLLFFLDSTRKKTCRIPKWIVALGGSNPNIEWLLQGLALQPQWGLVPPMERSRESVLDFLLCRLLVLEALGLCFPLHPYDKGYFPPH